MNHLFAAEMTKITECHDDKINPRPMCAMYCAVCSTRVHISKDLERITRHVPHNNKKYDNDTVPDNRITWNSCFFSVENVT